jgi:cytochrome P450
MHAPGEHLVLLTHPQQVKDVLVTQQRNFRKGRGLERARKLLGDGLLTSEGETHLRQRRLIQPAFHRERIASYGTVMTDCAVRARDRWPDGGTVDVAEEMMRLTLGIVGLTLFAADVEAQARSVGEALTAVLNSFWTTMLPFADLLEKLPIGILKRGRDARAELDRIIYGLIAERRARPGDRGDLLSMLLLAQDEEAGGRGMSDAQVRDEAMTIFLAGHETTANALSWTWYLLGQSPDVEARLHEEVDRVLGGRTPTIADIPNLTFVEQVLTESMRLYPPAWVYERIALADDVVGGFRVPKGTIVGVAPYVMHRNPRLFPDPERFDPERFDKARAKERPKHAYLPFGGGPRTCIGNAFAMMEMQIVLAMMAQSFRFEVQPGFELELEPSVTLRPKHGLPMRLARREASRG